MNKKKATYEINLIQYRSKAGKDYWKSSSFRIPDVIMATGTPEVKFGAWGTPDDTQNTSDWLADFQPPYNPGGKPNTYKKTDKSQKNVVQMGMWVNDKGNRCNSTLIDLSEALQWLGQNEAEIVVYRNSFREGNPKAPEWIAYLRPHEANFQRSNQQRGQQGQQRGNYSQNTATQAQPNRGPSTEADFGDDDNPF